MFYFIFSLQTKVHSNDKTLLSIVFIVALAKYVTAPAKYYSLQK